MTGMKHNILPIADLRKLALVFANYKSFKKDNEDKIKDNNEEDQKEGDGEEEGKREREEEGKRKGEYTGEENGKDKVHAFLVGQTCHWISVVSVSLLLFFSIFFYIIFFFDFYTFSVIRGRFVYN